MPRSWTQSSCCESARMRSRGFAMVRLLFMICAVLVAMHCPESAFAQRGEAAPFRFYTVQDGLNQRLVQAFDQDQHGFIWLATWGGVNRFDGRTFESLTTGNGLRLNGSTALHVDSHNGLWVGDTGGGLTYVEHGQPVRTYAPHPQRRSPVRSLATRAGVLYVGFQSLGAARLNLNDPDAKITPLPGLADRFVRAIAPAPSGKVLFLTVNDGLFGYAPDTDEAPRLIDASVTALRADAGGALAVGSRDGRIGLYHSNGIEWRSQAFGDRVTDLAFDRGTLAWVSTRTSIIRADSPEQRIPVNGPGRLLLDRDGTLWLLASSGLGRYLGDRFSHYPLERRGISSIVYAITSHSDGRFWFGTDQGLVMVDPDGHLVDVTEKLGLPRCEVRDVQLLPGETELWMGCVRGASQRIDLASMTPRPVFAGHARSVLAMERDAQGWIWAGTPFGQLVAEHPDKPGVRQFSFGRDKPIYSLAAGAKGSLWIAVQNNGLYRLATDQPGAQPEQVLSIADLGGHSPMHVAIRSDADGGDVVWIGTQGGSVVRWRSGAVDLRLRHHALASKSIYALVPLPDGTLAIGTERGLYRYDLNRSTLDFYGADEGFKGIETKNHASYLQNPGTLWIGTAAGAIRMNLELGMDSPAPPPPSIVGIRSAGQTYAWNAGSPVAIAGSSAVIDFAAVSTRAAEDIEISYRMLELDARWSEPGGQTSVEFGNLPAGELTFEVRARRSGERWSKPVAVVLRVPTPYWQSLPFRLACALALLAACAGLVRLRTIRVERANAVLKSQVEERTRSIALQTEQLKREIEERKNAESARDEMEDRFSARLSEFAFGHGTGQCRRRDSGC